MRAEKNITIQMCSIMDIIDDYKIEKIDLLNIDVEGLEDKILYSIDWDRIHPKYIIVEQKNITVEELINSNIYLYLKEKGYVCEWKNIRSVIYKTKFN